MSTPSFRETILKITPYVQGKPIDEVRRELGLSDVIKLASNENPLGPSPKALVAATKALQEANLYPDGANHNLKQNLAKHLGVEPERLIFGAGSSAVLKMIAETFFGPEDEIVFARPSFILYDFCANLMGSRPVPVPVRADYGHDLEAMAAAITPKTKAVIICNPNNPTGNIVTAAELDSFMSKVPDHVLVILDEAYFEYAADRDYPESLKYLRAGANAVVLRTFSKIYGLAGFRVGYGIGQPGTVELIHRVQEPFMVGSVTQAAALGALEDREHVARSRQVNEAGKAQLYTGARKLDLDYIPAHGNFIMINCRTDDRQLFQRLMELGVLVRPGGIFGMPGWLRVSVGTPVQNAVFLSALSEVLAAIRPASA